MCLTDPQKDLKSRKDDEPCSEPRQEWNSRDQLIQAKLQARRSLLCGFCLGVSPCASRLTMGDTLCAMRDVGLGRGFNAAEG